MTETQGHYFVPEPSRYPVMISGGLFLLALGFILKINAMPVGQWSMLAGFLVILYVLFGWFGTIISESEGGRYLKWEDSSFRWGMVWFIASEVAFFAAFFGALFYVRELSVPWLLDTQSLYPGYTGTWPLSGTGPGGKAFTPMSAWGIPAINTLILLTSGATVTWAHWGLLKNKRNQLIAGLFMTVALGLAFITLQAYEYHHAYTELGLTLGSGVYGATFFMLTGFHGFHVTMGTVMLIVILIRSMKGHFKADAHFGFEGVAWYWHFVDVVWLLLFVLVYWL